MRGNTKFKLIIGFLAIPALIISIYARFTPRFPGDLYLTLRLQSFDNHLLLSFMDRVSFIFGGWSSALVVVIIGILVWWRIGRLEATHAFKYTIEAGHQPSTALGGSGSHLIP
jgi:hypothetical protein